LKTANIFFSVFEPGARTKVRTGFFQSMLMMAAGAR